MVRQSLILCSLILVASCTMAIDAWDEETNYVDLNRSEAIVDDEVLDATVSLNVGKLEIEPTTGPNLFEVNIHYNDLAFKPEIDFSRENGRANLKVGLEGEGRSFRKLGENILNVRFSPDVDLNLTSSMGVSESRIDFTGLKLRSLELEAGVGDTEVVVLEKNPSSCDRVKVTSGVGGFEFVGIGNLNFKDFSFRGGVGGSSLDFSGEWENAGNVEIEVGVGGVEIMIPRDIGVKLRVSKGFFSGIEMSDFRKEGDTYYSDNLDHVEKVVEFRVRAGIGGVQIRWI